MKLSHRATIGLALASSLSLFSSTSHSAAFGIAEQSALGIGNAFAGGAASAQDASTIWYNPAGMTRIKGDQMVVGMHIIFPSFDFNDEGSTNGLGAPISGDGSNDGGRVAYVPNFYYVHSLSDDVKVGVGITAPFGLATKYDNDWVGKYQTIEAEIVTININPSFAWKATSDLSLGFGINIQYIEATLNNKIDFESICPAPVCGSAPSSDGFAHIEGDDWSLGFNLGLLYDLSEKTRIGFAYRSEVRHDLKGDADFDVPPSAATAPFGIGAALTTTFSDTHLESQPDLPASASLSVFHQMDNQLAVMADVTWTGWSSIQDLTILFDNPAKSDSVEILKYKDNIRLSVGATYDMNGPWTFRTGLAYDEGAARNQATRSARVPDNDRYWLTFGASYKLSDTLSIDGGYAHIFVPDTKINRPGATGDQLVGEYESDADILSAQIRWDM
jgi:long-chain fatty acid transport protein